MKRTVGLVVLLLTACSKSESPAPASASASSPAPSASTAAVFDVEGFCDKSMAVGRPCEGDDELMEGNQIGLCATTLRAARDEGVTLDAGAAAKCLADAEAAKPPLPDVRTLRTLAQRFDSCRAFTKDVPSLKGVSAVPVGSAKAGDACQQHHDCVVGHFCPRDSKKPACTAKKKAGQACRTSTECLGRCSRKGGSKCVPYCGAG